MNVKMKAPLASKRTDSDGERPLTNAECRALHSQEDAKEEEGASTIGRAFRPFWLFAFWEASAEARQKIFYGTNDREIGRI